MCIFAPANFSQIYKNPQSSNRNVSRQVAILSKPNFHTFPYSSFCISYSSLVLASTCDFIYNDLSKYVY